MPEHAEVPQRPPMAFRTNRVHAQHACDVVLGNYGQALELPSYGAAAERRLKVVEAVADRPERGAAVGALMRSAVEVPPATGHLDARALQETGDFQTIPPL